MEIKYYNVWNIADLRWTNANGQLSYDPYPMSKTYADALCTSLNYSHRSLIFEVREMEPSPTQEQRLDQQRREAHAMKYL